MWCDQQFLAFDAKINLDDTRRGRIESALTAFAEFCNSDQELHAAAAGAPFLQGSVATMTAVRPLVGDEFDVDVVYPFLYSAFSNGITPGATIEWFLSRLRQNAFYRDNLIPKDRCARIDYAGDFHVDIIPSTHELHAYQPYAVPSRDLNSWVVSDPIGFANWVRERDRSSGGYFVRAVRIMKRWRDEFFETDEAPSSMLITTFLGNHEPARGPYEPPLQDPLFPQYKHQAAYIYDLLRLTHSCLLGSEHRDLPFLNPVIPTEDLSRGWREEHLDTFLGRLQQCIGYLEAAIFANTEVASIENYRYAFGDTFPSN